MFSTDFDCTVFESIFWAIAFTCPFIFAFFIKIFFDVVSPNMKNKVSTCIFLGFIPGDILSIGYLSYTTHLIYFPFLLIIVIAVQIGFICVARGIFAALGICQEDCVDNFDDPFWNEP